MQSKYAEVTPRNFNPMWAPRLSDGARKAVNAAFDAMSTWRIETAKNSEKNSEQVIEKMAAAARALGWPEQIVDTTRAQMQSITKMQRSIRICCVALRSIGRTRCGRWANITKEFWGTPWDVLRYHVNSLSRHEVSARSKQDDHLQCNPSHTLYRTARL